MRYRTKNDNRYFLYSSDTTGLYRSHHSLLLGLITTDKHPIMLGREVDVQERLRMMKFVGVEKTHRYIFFIDWNVLSGGYARLPSASTVKVF